MSVHFERLRARVEDLVGQSYEVLSAVSSIVEDGLNVVEEVVESVQKQRPTDLIDVISPWSKEVLKDLAAVFADEQQQAEPAPPRAGGSSTDLPTLLKTINNYLVEEGYNSQVDGDNIRGLAIAGNFHHLMRAKGENIRFAD